MPRAQREGASEPKRRSRHGCWPCKNRKIKCGEEKPTCVNCARQGEICDYSIRLNWEGRTKRKNGENSPWSMEHLTPSTPPLRAVNSSQSPPRSISATPGLSQARSPNSKNNAFATSHPQSLGHARIRSQLSNSPPRPRSISPSTTVKTESTFNDASSYLGQSHYASLSPRVPASAPSWQPIDFQRPSFLGSQGEFDTNRESKRRRVDNVLEDPQLASSNRYSTYAMPQPTSFQTSLSDTSPAMPVTPLTPGLSVASEDSLTRPYAQMAHATQQQTDADLRRLSVKSLLQSPKDEEPRPMLFRTTSDDSLVYGYDEGRPDLDIPSNDDARALQVTPRPSIEDWSARRGSLEGFAFAMTAKDFHFEKGGYYAQPVPVKIPRTLEPLPRELLDHPMNLLYFHHFLNHTARILVPHDCVENPFRNVLPRMAIHDKNLLSLLLAYSASHRARLLNHPDPSGRIALLVRDVFPSLRRTLSTLPPSQISNSNLASAIMLASLEIISPDAFAITISWQSHLTVARQMIVARGGFQALPRKDEITYFLARWFAYLDVIGSLSGSNYNRPLAHSYLLQNSSEAEAPTVLRRSDSGDAVDDTTDLRRPSLQDLAAIDHGSSDPIADSTEIDCMLGCTSRCITLLARVANLAKFCDTQRVSRTTGRVDPTWQPPPAIALAAEKLKEGLLNRPTVFKHAHLKPANAGFWDATNNTASADEMLAISTSFHHAGLIHLYRRILNLPSTYPQVQDSVSSIVEAMSRTGSGGSAEACMIFPMFTAGCEAMDQMQKDLIHRRLENVEGYGMGQVKRARELMERVWSEGRDWVEMVGGEFFG